jgi:CubicO group peptidase (beta-lactamase class C family)
VDRIVTLVDEALANHLGSAAALSVGDAGREVARLVRGRSRRIPDEGPRIDEKAWFDVASLTKPMVTVACAMVLVGDGALDLDAPVRSYIDRAATTGTVRQLLAHCAGCASHVEFFRVLKEGNHSYKDLVEMAAREPVASEPGTSAVYSDLGFIMMGAVIERVTGSSLDHAFAKLVGEPLGLVARFVPTAGAIDTTGAALFGAVATEVDDRGLVCGVVHDENAYFGGGICGHAGLFARIDDVAKFAAAIIDSATGTARGRFKPDVVKHFLTDVPLAGSAWRLGWDTPATQPGVSQAGDRWSRRFGVGHTGFTGTSMWLDLQNKRWSILLTNRVHPSRHGSADGIKALRRAVNDAVVDLLDPAS